MAAVLTAQAAFDELADHCLTEACCRRRPDVPRDDEPECREARALYRTWRLAWKEGRR
jgi:hypothetical protein